MKKLNCSQIVSALDILELNMALGSAVEGQVQRAATELPGAVLRQLFALAELGVVENAVDDIAGLVHTSVPNIRALGGISGLELNEVVGVSWQLDHCIRSSTYGNIREQLYLIVLTTKSPRTGVVGTVEFTCTVAQLEELVYKLQEATHQIDKAIASFADPLSSA
ncbi:hypothetical protein DYB31_014214 [Aphanomyces astaci]|uniref:COMM domain-containing protein 3 n=1 Tax=Aphanomyces astaci TaxID=112090 RepID=A0A397EQ17_APHAT|nr:hypothetical protein DYB31_014214 [Aphanomyces astaci]